MGSSGSHDVTLEKEDDKYIVTEEGIKLSQALIGHMMVREPGNNASSEEIEALRKKATEAIMKEREKVLESQRVATATQELLKDREKQMNDLVETWKGKLEEQKNKHNDFYSLTMKEYEEAISQTEKKLKKPSLAPVCENFRDSVLKCYAENPKKTLHCSQQVSDFAKCVSTAKTSMLNRS